MSLVFAAIAPHSPILLPSVGREHVERLKKTVGSLKRLEQELYATAPQTLLIISPHGPVEAGHFTIDVNERYVCSLKEFGVMESPLRCGADMKLVNDLREHLEDRKIPVMLRSEEALDYGVIIPLTYLAAHLNKVSVIPLYPSLLDAKAHFEFGRTIQEVVMGTNRRVAIVASADLSHRLTDGAPGGFSPAANAFDEKVVQLISNKNSAGLINFDADLAKEAGECGLSTLTVLAGILDRLEAEPEILSYEGPFGIGHLVAHYRFP
jgi:aromatic ring-opening dioxygenase LigB subunit